MEDERIYPPIGCDPSKVCRVTDSLLSIGYEFLGVPKARQGVSEV
jgi:hypothetical protein